MIVAKPVIPNQFWILKENDRKVGNIEASPGGYAVRINNQTETYKTLTIIKQHVPIDFEKVSRKSKPVSNNSAYGFATLSRPYNSMYDVKHQVPLWTRDDKSKSWYTAGWYRLKQGRHWTTVFCPKLITLERYSYQGPFHTEEEANDQSI
jgi:hypothetical protein